MNFKNLAVTAVAAALPFAFTQEAIAAPSDCWWGVSGVGLDHQECDVERLQDDSGEYFEILMGNERIWVDLWVDDYDNPTVATLEAGPAGGGQTTKGDFPWKIDGDGDVRISLGNKALVFRFPDHPQAGTGHTALDPRRGGGGARPAGRDGLQQGDLSDTPFRF